MMRAAVHASALMLLLAAAAAAAAPPSIDSAFQKFWSARNPDDAVKAAAAVVSSGVTVDEALARLKRGRPYASQVKRGLVHLQRRSVAGEFFYDLAIPDAYDPQRPYQVRVQLHGGVMMRETSQPRSGRGGAGVTLPGAEQIYVMPVSWRDAPWWSRVQLENVDAILDSVKRTYNVDENHVVAAGVSDGATGLYYVAMRDTTPFASFLPLNGFMMVLANDRVGADADLFPTNLLNKPLFVVNGGEDPLYPIRSVEPYVGHLRGSGVTIDYHPRPEAGHNTAWWPEMKDAFETFVRDHPRNPYPDKLTWEATDHDLPSRAHWIVIDRVRPPTASEPRLEPDLNVFSGAGPNHGRDLFGRARPSGRVDAVRRGNVVELTTRGVSDLTVLLSPDVFDFSQPIRVTANRRVVADGVQQPSLATMMKWAAKDNDRTMLFSGEIHVSIK
jgi:pimeloyl-ACP methyl ester carboxylesterase